MLEWNQTSSAKNQLTILFFPFPVTLGLAALAQRVTKEEMDPEIYCANRSNEEFFRKIPPEGIDENAVSPPEEGSSFEIHTLVRPNTLL